jgi:oxygen-independent coproporphyrinogen-3 oxidase
MMIDTLLRYDTNAPRYTSYPPANLFRTAETKRQIETIWRESNTLNPRNLSFYFHIPFCSKRCLFCGCTSEVMQDVSARDRYFEALYSEMAEKLPWISENRPVTQVHFGGGTPTSVPFEFLETILYKLRSRFSLRNTLKSLLNAILRASLKKNSALSRSWVLTASAMVFRILIRKFFRSSDGILLFCP